MKQRLMISGLFVTGVLVLTGSVFAEEYTTTSYDPALDAYRYSAPADSWYTAKVKPKPNTQMETKAPDNVNAEPVNIPETENAPVSKAEVSDSPFVDETIANSPIAKSPESTRALPFWQDILPADVQQPQ